MDVRKLPGIDIVIADGSLFVNERFTFNEGPASVGYVAAGDGFKIPLWLPTLFAAALAAIPWVGWQYSLRTLLIAITLIAVVLWLVVWVSR